MIEGSLIGMGGQNQQKELQITQNDVNEGVSEGENDDGDISKIVFSWV